MLTLNDGRSELWQWDTGRKLTVDADCTQVHFSNKFFGRSVDVDVVDGVAEIPDVLLQVDKDLLVWAFVGTAENGYTKISKVFKVNKRNKPADYVFTPTEQTTLDEIMKRLSQIEESQDPDAIKKAVDDYLANNPIEIEETDPTVPDWAKEKEKPKYTAKEVGALAKEDLQGGIDEALAQAKQSGEFDGKDGVTPDFSIGTVETLEPGSDATASISGTKENPVLNLGIPRGLPGEGESGGGEVWELVHEVTTTEEVNSITVKDLNLRKAYIAVKAVGSSANGSGGNGAILINGFTYFYSSNLQLAEGVSRWCDSLVSVIGGCKKHISSTNNNNSYQTQGVQSGWFGDGTPINRIVISATVGANKMLGVGTHIAVYGVKA